MDRDTANALIETLWDIETRLTTALRDIAAIERRLADSVADEG